MGTSAEQRIRQVKPLKPKEDRLHRPTDQLHWRESYYFNFHDAAGRAGLTYLSLSPGRAIAERSTMLMLPEIGQTLVCIQQDPLSRFEDEVLKEGFPQYHCLEPLRRWRISGEADCLAIPPGQEISTASNDNLTDLHQGYLQADQGIRRNRVRCQVCRRRRGWVGVGPR